MECQGCLKAVVNTELNGNAAVALQMPHLQLQGKKKGLINHNNIVKEVSSLTSQKD